MALVVTDSFDRADNVSLGANWTTVTAGWDATGFQIASNKATPQALSGDDLEIYTGSSFSVNHYAQAKIAVTGTNVSSGPGVAVRASTDGSCYSITVNKNASGNLVIARRGVSNGTFTVLANPTVTWVDGDTLKVKIVGNVIYVYQNGTPVETPVTDSTPLTTGAPGIIHSTSITSGSVDDFEAGDIEMQSYYYAQRRSVRR